MSILLCRVLCVTALVLGIYSVPASAAATGGPKIVFDKTEITYPNAREGQTLSAQFTFANQGKMNLIIDSVTPSCGCAVAKFDKVIKPGEKGVINMELDTSGITGAFRKTAVVATNDVSNPFATMVMIGETSSRVKVDKGRRLDLVGCLGKEISATATLTEPDGKPLLIAGVENPMHDYLETKLTPQPGGREYKLQVTAKAKEPMDFAGPLYLIVPGSSKVSLYVVAEVRGPFSVAPQEVYFGGVKRGMTGLARPVTVTKTCSETLTIDKLLYNPDRLKVEEQWLTPGAQAQIMVSPNLEKMSAGPFEERLGIQSGDKVYHVTLKGVIN
jgi:hypothetical protein